MASNDNFDEQSTLKEELNRKVSYATTMQSK